MMALQLLILQAGIDLPQRSRQLLPLLWPGRVIPLHLLMCCTELLHHGRLQVSHSTLEEKQDCFFSPFPACSGFWEETQSTDIEQRCGLGSSTTLLTCGLIWTPQDQLRLRQTCAILLKPLRAANRVKVRNRFPTPRTFTKRSL